MELLSEVFFPGIEIMFDAIILAGGLGTRLREVVGDVPKPMALVKGKPFLELQLEFLIRQGFSRALLSIGYKGDVIANHFGSRYRTLNLVYVREDRPLGTGGAVRAALSFCQSEAVFVFNGDTYIDLDCSDILKYWAIKPRGVIVGRVVSNPGRFGRLLLDGDNVIGIDNDCTATGDTIINAGCYLLPRDSLDTAPMTQPFSLERDFLPSCLPHNPFALHLMNGLFIDIGVPSDYALSQSLLASVAVSRNGGSGETSNMTASSTEERSRPQRQHLAHGES